MRLYLTIFCRTPINLFSFFIIWNRFIRERLPKEIVAQPIFNEITLIIMLLCFFWFSLHIYYLLKMLQILPRPNSKISFLIKSFAEHFSEKKIIIIFSNIINDTFIQGPTNTYNMIYRLVYVKPFIHFIGAKLSYYFVDQPFTPYFIGIVLPRVIPWFILLYELIGYQQIKYFYHSLLLLLFPLLFRIILHMIKHHAIKSLDYYKYYFDFILQEGTLHIFFNKLADPVDKQKQEEIAPYAYKEWEFYQYLYNIAYQIQSLNDTYKNHLNACVYGMMGIAFLIQSLLLLGWYPKQFNNY